MKLNPITKFILFVLLILFSVVALFLILDVVFGLNNTNIFLDRLGLNKEEYVVVDLEVEVLEGNQEVIEGITTLGIISNKELNIKEDSERFNLVLVSSSEDEYKYVLEAMLIPVGTSSLKFTLIDKDMIEQPVSVAVNRTGRFSFLGRQYVDPWEGFTYIFDGSDLLSRVDKQHRLLNSFVPQDLVNLRDTYIDLYVNNDDFELQAEAADYLNIMLANMRAEIGKNVVVASAYRSYNTQAQVYSGYVAGGTPRAEVDNLSARPGFSEHQLGTVIDFTNEESGFQFTTEFDNTLAGRWLLDNAWEYGFVQTYPKGSEDLTGYNYEAWHYRYIGPENAEALKDSGLVFTEWLNTI